MQYLELACGKHSIANPVRRNLKKIFKQGNTPAYQCRNHPWTMIEFLEAGVPRKGYNGIAEAGQGNGCDDGSHSTRGQSPFTTYTERQSSRRWKGL